MDDHSFELMDELNVGTPMFYGHSTDRTSFHFKAKTLSEISQSIYTEVFFLPCT